MKKLIHITSICLILNFLINFCNPMIVSEAATTGTVYLSANKDIIEKGEEIEIGFYIKDINTAAYSATIYFDETKFDWISGPENSNVEGNQIRIVWYDTQGGKGAKQGKLGKIRLKAKEEGLANFVIDGEFFSNKEQLIQTKFETLQIQIGREETNLEKQVKEEQGSNTGASNANLQSMRISEAGTVPDFQTNIYNYDLTVDNAIRNIEVLAVTQNPDATVSITGNTRIKRRFEYY